MARSPLVALAIVAVGAAAEAITFTATPDKSVHNVGENIVLNVFGDSEGAAAGQVLGLIRFEEDLTIFVSSSQTPLTSFGGTVLWAVGPLNNGPGFTVAFNQAISVNPHVPDAPLTATVTLQAIAPGAPTLAWDTAPEVHDFFGLTNPTGASLTIVPEPSTVLLLALGLAAIAAFAPPRSPGAP